MSLPLPNLLQVKGADIINGRNEIVHLRGFCLGGWRNKGNFIICYPGNNTSFRVALAITLGKEGAELFFERFLGYFIQADDTSSYPYFYQPRQELVNLLGLKLLRYHDRVAENEISMYT